MKALNQGDKDKALEQVMNDIEKQFGKGSIMKLGDTTHLKVDVCSSGCLSLDIALGVGGYPRGRIIEIYGYKLLLNIKKQEDEQHLLMQNMHLILFMQKS